MLILLVLLLLILLVPAYGYRADIGYWPGGLLGLVLAVVLILWLLGRL